MYIAAREVQDVEEQMPTHELAHKDERKVIELFNKSYFIDTVHIVEKETEFEDD